MELNSYCNIQKAFFNVYNLVYFSVSFANKYNRLSRKIKKKNYAFMMNEVNLPSYRIRFTAKY